MTHQPTSTDAGCCVFSRKVIEQDRDEIEQLRNLSMKDRGRMLEEACRLAEVLYQSRLRAGLPDVQPAPWPESTLEFLRKHAPHGKR